MIVVAGYGHVGKAYCAVFKHYFELEVVDPSYNDKKIYDVKNLEAVICCVGTPERPDGACDGTYVLEVIRDTPIDIPILIKSTISLEVWREIKLQFPAHKVAFSPEFLKAISSIEDLAESTSFIVSGSNVSFWRKFYKKRFPKAKIRLTAPEEAIMIKYMRNAYLATKVSFFNQVFDLCSSLNIDFESVRHGIASDNRIGASHTFVDDTFARGWGGFCFPKDTAALLKIADENQVTLSLLKTAVEYNQDIRK